MRADELAKLTGREPGGDAMKSALRRVAQQGLVTLATKRPSTWLIVPPEHSHFGAPPVEWWLDDYLKDVEPHYYLALLSAARHWGSAHYALQATQVMVSRPRRAQTIGRLRLDFTVKKSIDKTPVDYVTTPVARLRVSTREATLLDLVRHQSQVGGIESVARIAKDLAPSLKSDALLQTLDALDQVPAVQRLGFVLDTLKLGEQSHVLKSWLTGRHRASQPLEPAKVAPSGVLHDSTWGVEHTLHQRNSISELA
ncbi:hypothetical protein APY03_2491 [Variovorax sp. WDL1]|nr:hypothetical protein APY03_2491 [Variovorax sp. WDL1]